MLVGMTIDLIHSDTSLACAGSALAARESELLVRLADKQRVIFGQADDGLPREATDFKEEAQRALQDRMADVQEQRDHAELLEVRAAMARLQSGHYGVCSDCAQPISPQRLELRPWAIRCTACQSARESLLTSARTAV